MNRETLFRGKNLNNGEWVEGDLQIDRDLDSAYISGYYYYQNEEGHQREWFCNEVDPETVGQYTGLKDENGAKIFEGDICDVTIFDHDGTDTQHTLVVSFVDGGYALSGAGCFIFMYDVDDAENEIKVIGNIHDNPELGGERA